MYVTPKEMRKSGTGIAGEWELLPAPSPDPPAHEETSTKGRGRPLLLAPLPPHLCACGHGPSNRANHPRQRRGKSSSHALLRTPTPAASRARCVATYLTAAAACRSRAFCRGWLSLCCRAVRSLFVLHNLLRDRGGPRLRRPLLPRRGLPRLLTGSVPAVALAVLLGRPPLELPAVRQVVNSVRAERDVVGLLPVLAVSQETQQTPRAQLVRALTVPPLEAQVLLLAVVKQLLLLPRLQTLCTLAIPLKASCIPRIYLLRICGASEPRPVPSGANSKQSPRSASACGCQHALIATLPVTPVAHSPAGSWPAWNGSPKKRDTGKPVNLAVSGCCSCCACAFSASRGLRRGPSAMAKGRAQTMQLGRAATGSD